MLSLFGSDYATQALVCLQWLALWSVPLLIKDHYVVVCRLERRTGQAAALLGVGGLVELSMAAVGATFYGLPGLSIGWLVGGCLQAVFMLPAIYRASVSPIKPTMPMMKAGGLVRAGQEAYS